jgi:hypothetical protein
MAPEPCREVICREIVPTRVEWDGRLLGRASRPKEFMPPRAARGPRRPVNWNQREARGRRNAVT